MARNSGKYDLRTENNQVNEGDFVEIHLDDHAVNYRRSTGEPFKNIYRARDVVETNEGGLALYEGEGKRPLLTNFLRSVASYNPGVSNMEKTKDQDAVSEQVTVKRNKMGTLIGVYLPTLQNIFGVLLFLRLTWIVGSAGVLQAFLVVALSCCTTLLTAISMSAIATNGKVPAGGSYFMISRSLGPEFGGAVGILFYLATTFAASMYILGAIEILLTYMAPMLSLFGEIQPSADGGISQEMFNNMRVYGTILLLILSLIVFIGVQYVNKFASFFLACVIVSIISIYIGVIVANPDIGPRICLIGDKLLMSGNYTCSPNSTFLSDLYNASELALLREIPGIPGIASGIFTENALSKYMSKGETTPGVKAVGNQVAADITTSFTVLIAIFFPSVTGIMAGSNRSGDLEDAQKSIPKGTIAAIVTTSLVYLTCVLLMGATIEGPLLRDKFGTSLKGSLVLGELCWPHPWVMLIGSFLSTVGAGLQSLTGAPRLLQAIASDSIIPILDFFKVTSKSGEPTRALILTFFIAEIGIIIASLDSVAPIITIFFLMCYSFVNLACTLQSLLKAPSWRPRFRYFHWTGSLIGLGLCIAMMIITGWYYALGALAIACVIYKYIEYSGARKEWGDGLRGLAMQTARHSLLHLEDGPPHTKNWRPQLLVLAKLNKHSENPLHQRMLSFASQLKKGKGLTIAASVVEGDVTNNAAQADEVRETLKGCMSEEKIKGFTDVIVSKDVVQGLCDLIQSCGMGGLKPNTVVLNWPDNWPSKSSWRLLVRVIRTALAKKMAVVIPKNISLFPERSDRLNGNIDIWWIVHDGGLLMLLPFLFKQHKVWRNCRLRIFTVAQMKDNSIKLEQDMKKLVYDLRIDAYVEVVEMTDNDISAYTYERTLRMEQRNEVLNKMKLSRKEQDKAKSVFDPFRSLPKGDETPSDAKQTSQNIVGRFAVKVVGSDDTATSSTSSHTEPDGDKETKVTESRFNVKVIEPTNNEDDKHLQHKFSKSKFAVTAIDEGANEASSLSVLGASRHADRPSFGADNSYYRKLRSAKPFEGNLRRMDAAVKLNRVIVEKSTDAEAVFINLPVLPSSDSEDRNYLEFISVLTDKLSKVVMVAGGGTEVITFLS
ncbi:Solute carrier family 12 member 6 [Trichoplax sp. H2]|nr:Solute carrier family 12 member 6 [Trichoplax sp. H2]|eukprot:RDD47585.1 Solute carrier family 12 member 6 [Trichoplax sp. H2]